MKSRILCGLAFRFPKLETISPHMATTGPVNTSTDDPRKLREFVSVALQHAHEHRVTTVAVGLAGQEGDLMLPEVIDFVESSLRVEDHIFRMTRERAVLFVADVDCKQAQDIMERLLRAFVVNFPQPTQPQLDLGFFEIRQDEHDLQIKELLPAIFPPSSKVS